jgi:hypothetical protein
MGEMREMKEKKLLHLPYLPHLPYYFLSLKSILIRTSTVFPSSCNRCNLSPPLKRGAGGI